MQPNCTGGKGAVHFCCAGAMPRCCAIDVFCPECVEAFQQKYDVERFIDELPVGCQVCDAVCEMDTASLVEFAVLDRLEVIEHIVIPFQLYFGPSALTLGLSICQMKDEERVLVECKGTSIAFGESLSMYSQSITHRSRKRMSFRSITHRYLKSRRTLKSVQCSM